MFGKRKKEYEILQKALENLENSQKSTETMVKMFCNMLEENKEQEILQKSINSLENTQKNTELMIRSFCNALNTNADQKVVFMDKPQSDIEVEVEEVEKRRAAYALNLCTVSVSQIIDYDDANILEQEYETILNNLNLENMPKDEALLNILKQILDTVTFFRIQESERAFIEKEYQQKMKNAIWSAVPNFGLVIAAGNPYLMAMSLATQVGIGYMNYRKTKAEGKLNMEKQMWQLQRSAIEQLNGLRRELFDASWRLADRYGFKDEYRLTERQITQYNKILMDADDYRRYERLEAISQYFVAYPSFWYHFGHAANCIAQKGMKDNEIDIYEKYKEYAINHFEKYMNSDKYALLREDHITSSCALEYIDLLDVEKDKDKIKYLLDRAIKMSGQACDILQLCAIGYLRISEYDSAIYLLKYLINENYNSIINAQLLSSLYVSEIVNKNNIGLIAEYKILEKKIPKELLFPFPSEGVSIDLLKNEFVTKQQKILEQRYIYVIRHYYEKCTVAFNKCIPAPYDNKNYPDAFYSDTSDSRNERNKQYKNLIKNKNKAEEYARRLLNSDFSLGFLDTLNEMANGIESILPGTDIEKKKHMSELAGDVEKKIIENSDTIKKLQEELNKVFGVEQFICLFNLSFNLFTQEFWSRLIMIVNNHINNIKTMSDFSKDETMLLDFCVKQNIPEFKTNIVLLQNQYNEYTGDKVYFTNELLGGGVSETLKIARKMARCIDDNIIKIIPQTDMVNGKTKEKIKTTICTAWNKENRQRFRSFINDRSYDKEFNDKIIAVLDTNKFGVQELVFTIDGIFVHKPLIKKPNPTKYSEIKLDNKGKLRIGNDSYGNKEININALDDLIQELAELSELLEIQGSQFISSDNKYMIEIN